MKFNPQLDPKDQDLSREYQERLAHQARQQQFAAENRPYHEVHAEFRPGKSARILVVLRRLVAGVVLEHDRPPMKPVPDKPEPR